MKNLLKIHFTVTDHSCIQLIMIERFQLSDYISETLETDVFTIHVIFNKNLTDIICYIENSIHKSSILKKVSAKLWAEIVEKFLIDVQNMFIWVDFMLKELLKKRSKMTIYKSLNTASKKLKKMLHHVLESFSSSLTEDESENLNELLIWIICAQ